MASKLLDSKQSIFMNRGSLQKLDRWYGPRLSRLSWRFWTPLRKALEFRMERLVSIEVKNPDVLEGLISDNIGVMLTPNHSSHADPFAVYGISDVVNCPMYFMVAWEVYGKASWLKRLGLSHHGCFSVDREGTDMRALRQAMEILQQAKFPLVVFPEGEIYHINERITPFREGAASIALMAARKSTRPVACLPVGVRYYYVEDPTSELLEVMNQLEIKLFWRPRPDLSLPDRIYRIAEGILALKELEYTGQVASTSIPERLHQLSDLVLKTVEQRHEIEPQSGTIPERIKEARRRIIKKYAEAEQQTDSNFLIKPLEKDLDDLYLVVQLFSYPGDYVREKPSLERIAETIDKFEEDGLGFTQPRRRGTRKAIIEFGEPVVLEPGKKTRLKPAELTHQIEEQVQSLLSQED